MRCNGHLQRMHGGGNQRPRFPRQAGHARAKAGVTHQHARPQVMRRLPQPGRVQPAATVRAPGRLALVKVGGAALADVVRGVVAPGHGVPQVTICIHKIGDQWQAPGQRGLTVQAGQQGLNGFGGTSGVNRALQMRASHAA